MASPFLPAEHISQSFHDMKAAMPNTVDEWLSDLVAYIETWVTSRLWLPKSWSVYRCSIRTNNDVEGWHNRLNQKSRRGHLDLYQLVTLLFAEAQLSTSKRDWCPSHDCADTRGNNTHEFRGSWSPTGRNMRQGSWQRQHCCASVHGPVEYSDSVRPPTVVGRSDVSLLHRSQICLQHDFYTWMKTPCAYGQYKNYNNNINKISYIS